MPETCSPRQNAPQGIDRRAFRDTVGCFATGVTVVTTCDGAGTRLGVTVNSFASLSLDPPLVMFALRRESATLPIIRGVGCFAVNVLAAGQKRIAHRFSAGPPEWNGLDVQVLATGAPVFRGCLAALDCRLEAIHQGGDHEILVGEVLAMDRAVPAPEPLIYLHGDYASLE